MFSSLPASLLVPFCFVLCCSDFILYEEQRDRVSCIVSLLPKCPHQPMLGQAKDRGWAFNSRLTHGWQEPKYLGNVSCLPEHTPAGSYSKEKWSGLPPSKHSAMMRGGPKQADPNACSHQLPLCVCLRFICLFYLKGGMTK